MAQLSAYRYELLYRILSKICECEGGTLVVNKTSGSLTIRIVPDIPFELWCTACRKRYACQAKLIRRWNTKIELNNGDIQ